MRLKIEGVLILCIIVVLDNTCFEKFAPKVRQLVDDLLPVKSLVRYISQTIKGIEKKVFDYKLISLMYEYILLKFQFRCLDPFQRER